MKRRGLTLVELMATLAAAGMAIAGAFAVLLNSMQSFRRIQSDVSVSQPNSQAVRRITETLRGAFSITISNSGRTISYTLPAYTSIADPISGERELAFPLRSDGTARSFAVANGLLTANPGGRVLMRNVLATDPLPGSTQYNLAYAPFQSTTIGSRRAITVTLIAQETIRGKPRYARMKSTVLIQNAK